MLSVLARIFFPLQGFFNFLVFIYPKVMHEKTSQRNNAISWYRTFLKAVQSRGARVWRIKVDSKKKLGGCFGCVGKGSKIKVKTAEKKKKTRAPQIQEEEKCEIVATTSTLRTTKSSSALYSSNVTNDDGLSVDDIESGDASVHQRSLIDVSNGDGQEQDVQFCGDNDRTDDPKVSATVSTSKDQNLHLYNDDENTQRLLVTENKQSKPEEIEEENKMGSN